MRRAPARLPRQSSAPAAPSTSLAWRKPDAFEKLLPVGPHHGAEERGDGLRGGAAQGVARQFGGGARR